MLILMLRPQTTPLEETEGSAAAATPHTRRYPIPRGKCVGGSNELVRLLVLLVLVLVLMLVMLLLPPCPSCPC